MPHNHYPLKNTFIEVEDSTARIKIYTSSPHLSLERYEASGKTKGGLIPETALQQMAIETPSNLHLLQTR